MQPISILPGGEEANTYRCDNTMLYLCQLVVSILLEGVVGVRAVEWLC